MNLHHFNPLFICCNLYDSEGTLMEWNLEEFNKFVNNKKHEIIIWECGDKVP